MSKEVMTRKASDNPYLHKHFHCSLNESLEYLRVNFGEADVREYLRRFAASFHAPLQNDLCRRGLPALREYFEKIYRIEGGQIEMTGNENELRINIKYCPAVEYISKSGDKLSPAYAEIAQVINQFICENTPFAFEMCEYNPETGASRQRFYRRAT